MIAPGRGCSLTGNLFSGLAKELRELGLVLHLQLAHVLLAGVEFVTLSSHAITSSGLRMTSSIGVSFVSHRVLRRIRRERSLLSVAGASEIAPAMRTLKRRYCKSVRYRTDRGRFMSRPFVGFTVRWRNRGEREFRASPQTKAAICVHRKPLLPLTALGELGVQRIKPRRRKSFPKSAMVREA